ncbi:alpha/beta-hydrolase [Myriangium duriaei CBS 260.36]|uniref:triacylglycerol lipase n=1 Tax=Myriangium duriaei CBS 260.36 TaxID=1168546 RepID=A0A9P4J1G3_9PEZI|nr:alpha/beta-hydrolase [Myriangium duriaei CBS 260.36]
MRCTAGALVTLLAAWASFPAASARSQQQEQQVLLPPTAQFPHSSHQVPQESSKSIQFSLRHVYHAGSHKYPGLLRKLDIGNDTAFALGYNAEESMPGVSPSTIFEVSSKSTRIERMVDRSHGTINNILDAGRIAGQTSYLPPSAWAVDEVPGPNVSDKQSVLALAQMAANAYILKPRTGAWEDIKGAFNYTEDFGWEEDGLRGHIFADTTNSTIVIGLKGTSMAIFDGAETTGHDKENDNLFGSCCCAQGGQFWWKQVCDCQTSAYTCNNTCLTKSLREKSHYYHAAKDLYANVTERYPGAQVWLTGHSLGGVVTALLGLTYGLPVVTFEAFPDALAAGRLGLPTPPGYHIGRHQDRKNTGVYHFGHTADPVFMGTCNAASSSCTLAGYAFQSQCHTGSVCTYDTVGDLGWRPGIGTHRITSVVRDVIKKYDDVPGCEVDDDCVDCFNWKFYESNRTEGTTTAPTSTTTTRTNTRTETCKTPGWWGCLDETTSSTVTETSTVTTTTCLTPGWFGCKDEATTTFTTTITTSAPAPAPTVTTIPPSTTTMEPTSSSSLSSSTTCVSKGWFGCNDSESTAASSSTVAKPTPSSSSSTTCVSKGWFGCNDPGPTSASTASATGSISSTTTCTSKEWFGLICVDPSPDARSTPDL